MGVRLSPEGCLVLGNQGATGTDGADEASGSLVAGDVRIAPEGGDREHAHQ